MKMVRRLLVAVLSLGAIPLLTLTAAPANAAGGSPAGHAVTTAAQLTTALAAATAGTVIDLASGTYLGSFKATVSGTQVGNTVACGQTVIGAASGLQRRLQLTRASR